MHHLGILLAVAALVPLTYAQGDTLAYAGGQGNTRFTDVHALSEGAVLIAGGADNLDWLPRETKRVELGGAPGSAGSDKVAFVLLANNDLSRISTALFLPKGVAKSIRWIKTTNVPGAPTGEVFLSGENAGGYFVAKLNGNFVGTLPTGLVWFHQAKAKKEIASAQPWDVGGDGRVVLATGEAHSPDWADVQRLEPDGKPGVVEHWRNHWSEGGVDWQGTPASANPNGKSVRSAMVFKVTNRGSLRSWTEADYKALTPDGNGGTKQGRWPWDYYFSGPFHVSDPASSPGGPGYTGYKWGRNPVGHPQAVAVDRRNNDIYLGGNNQSKLPDGQPDFEPFILAFTKEGSQKWWQRLYKETPQNSSPDQYVDGLAIDYSAESALVVLARCHGNNVINFWAGNKIEHPKNPGSSFQNQFTGKNGNIHIGWLGRLTLGEGTMLHATYVAEWGDSAKPGVRAHPDTNLDGWPSPNEGWPDLNTTRCQPALHVDLAGNIYLIGTGRRIITTANAFQKMPKIGEGEGKWSDFVRAYDRELKTLKFSSLVTGAWDHTTKGAPSSDVRLEGVYPHKEGILVSGYAPLAKDGNLAQGPDMPVKNVPSWATKTRTGEMGVIGLLKLPR